MGILPKKPAMVAVFAELDDGGDLLGDWGGAGAAGG